MAIELVPNSVNAYYNRGICYMDKGSKAEAANDFNWLFENSETKEEKDIAIVLLRELGIKRTP